MYACILLGEIREKPSLPAKVYIHKQTEAHCVQIAYAYIYSEHALSCSHLKAIFRMRLVNKRYPTPMTGSLSKYNNDHTNCVSETWYVFPTVQQGSILL